MRRADGNSFEVGGISEEAADAYSDRSKELRDRFRELEAQYVRDHGHAPAKQARWALKQRAALETRDAKEHNPPAPGRELDRVGAQSGAARRGEAGRAPRSSQPPTRPSTRRASCRASAERARTIRVAVAEVQRQNAVWDRSQLIFELGRALPSLPADVDPEEYLDELADEAVSGRAEDVTVLQIAPAPDVIDVTRLGVPEGRDVDLPAAVRGDGSAPPSTATVSSGWSTSRCCRYRSGSPPEAAAAALDGHRPGLFPARGVRSAC